MKNYLEKTLRQNIHIETIDFPKEKFPLVFKGRYTLFAVETSGQKWLAIQPKSEAGIVMLRKDHAKIELTTGLNCALFLEKTTFYIREKLMEEGIPFVIKEKHIYLPFVGYLLSDNNKRDIAPVHLISFLTQKMFFTAIYNKWNSVTVSEAAKNLGVSKMSVSRCFDEIEYLNIDILGMKGKSRVITIPEDTKSLWLDAVDKLRNPVIETFVLREDLKLDKTAGISALCQYSLLSDNSYPTYAVTKKEIADLEIKTRKQTHPGENIGCVVLELGYFLDFGNNIQDPLSTSLSLTNAEKQDERVSASVNKMLEENVWSKD